MRLLKMGARWAFNCSKWNPSESDVLLATSCVQLEEKYRLDKFVFKKDVKSSIIGRLMMRKYVSEVTNIPYNQARFVRDDRGKPVLESVDFKFRNLGFNVSHQGDFVVFAGEIDVPMIGVDVMKLEYSGGKSLNEFFRLMTRQFSNFEWVNIKSCTDENKQLGMFCRHWSLKESYVKAIGVGITVNLQDISFKVNTKDLRSDLLTCDTELYVKNQKEDWVFEEMLLNDEHCVSVAMKREYAEKNGAAMFKEIDFEELTINSIPLLEKDISYVRNYFSKLDK